MTEWVRGLPLIHGDWSQCDHTAGHRACQVREEPPGREGSKQLRARFITQKGPKTIVSFLQQAFVKHLLCTTLKAMDIKTVG